MSLDSVFSAVGADLEQQEEIRESIKGVVRRMDNAIRKRIHTQVKDASIICKEVVSSSNATVTPVMAELNELIKPSELYRYLGIFSNQLQQIVCNLAIVKFVEYNQLLIPDDTIGALAGLKIPLDDYLLGLCSAVSEISRFCVNSAAASDFLMSKQASEFVNNVYAGFRQLNLKNDVLRRRYDGLKYDVKRCEEVMFEVSIRDLIKTSDKKPRLE